MSETKPFSEDERKHYAAMVAMLINGDPDRKARLDKTVRQALSTLREAMPGASDEILVSFCGSVSFLMAKIMHTSVLDIAELVDGIFDNYITAAAVIMNAYQLDGEDMPEADPALSKVFGDFSERRRSSGHFTDADFEEILNRQYL